MSLRQGQNIKIFGKDPTDDTQVELFVPGDVDSLVHETRLPGGFWTMKFKIPMTGAEYWDWRLNRQWFRAQLELGSATLLWEGRLQRYEGPMSAPTLTFGGYYNNFRDSVNNNKTYVRSYNTPADTIIKDMLDLGFHADTLQINNTDQSNIVALPGAVAINQTYNKDLNLWEVLTNPTNGVLNTGDANDNIVDFAVWDDRIVELTIRDTATVTWRAYVSDDLGGVRGDLSPRVDLMEIENAITALYEDGGEQETAVSAKTLNTVKEIRREFTIANSSSDSATAVSRASTRLAVKQDAQQQVDNFIITKVFDSQGNQQPICNVRAGEVIQVADLVDPSVDVNTVTLDAFRTFFIQQTTCRHERNELVIRPDRESISLDARLARNRIQ